MVLRTQQAQLGFRQGFAQSLAMLTLPCEVLGVVAGLIERLGHHRRRHPFPDHRVSGLLGADLSVYCGRDLDRYPEQRAIRCTVSLDRWATEVVIPALTGRT